MVHSLNEVENSIIFKISIILYIRIMTNLLASTYCTYAHPHIKIYEDLQIDYSEGLHLISIFQKDFTSNYSVVIIQSVIVDLFGDYILKIS